MISYWELSESGGSIGPQMVFIEKIWETYDKSVDLDAPYG